MLPEDLSKLTEEELQELANNITEEEFEQLDELSKQTLGSYMGKAMGDIMDTKYRDKGGKVPLVRGAAGQKLKAKRAAGMRVAGRKWLKKEEEQVDEVDSTLEEETPAQASVKAKSVDLAKMLNQMAGMDSKDLTKIKDVLAQVGKEADKLPAGANAGANKHSVDAVGDAKAATMFSVKEDLKGLFDGHEDLSEEFMEKVETIFEAALNIRVTVEREAIMEEAAEVVEELVEEHMEVLEEKLNDYLDYVVEEWKEENKIALEAGIRTNQMEAFMSDLLELMEEHNIDLPEEKVDVVEELLGELEDLENALNEQIEKNIENQKIIDEARRDEAFDEISEGLAATQIEKLRTLAEGIDFSNIDEYKKKITTLRDHHFKEVKPSSNLSEQIDNSDKNNREPTAKPAPSGSMARYTSAISQSLKK